MRDRIIRSATQQPKLVLLLVLALVLGLGAQLPRVKIDTDPENMLRADEAARVFHNQVKGRFTLHDMLVVGVVNDSHPDGVFNPASLAQIHKLSEKVAQIEGVIAHDLMSPSTVDNVTPEGGGTVRFAWLVERAPKTRQEALAVRDAARKLPLLEGTILSEDGRAVALHVSIRRKSDSYRISREIEQIVAGYSGEERYYISGLPVAEDTFGVQMFVQMAISAPLAALVIFLLMWWFFRSLALIASPMLLAMATVIGTMGLLVASGFTVHIMSSMIPIFLMPIAVVDSVHILSEFADRYRPGTDPRALVREVMAALFTPMLYTSLTSAAGFASLAFTPIPPVRVFGMFVAFGILLAFALTVTFIPAYIATLSPRRLARLGAPTAESDHGLLQRLLPWIGRRSVVRAKALLLLAAAGVALGAYGITRIQINDNPVRWFRSSHPIRVADRVLNDHFAGTYPAFLVLSAADDPRSQRQLTEQVQAVLAAARTKGVDVGDQWKRMRQAAPTAPFTKRLSELVEALDEQIDSADQQEGEVWEALRDAHEGAQVDQKLFHSPAALRYVEALQEELRRSPVVGKSSSLADIVKTVHRALQEGEPDQYVIPNTSEAVAQTLLSFQSSHRPHDLWHFVTPDLRSANIWVQLKSGDNQDMARVVKQIERFVTSRPPPAGVSVEWAGLTYINVIWQQKMVAGMLNSLLGAFVVVTLMMVALFRSPTFGILAMIPLSVTIIFTYGLIGLVGKDYDMPVAVLSSLTLGLSVDFAIHFLQRLRAVRARRADWRESLQEMFQEPGRAIARNAVIIAIGFLPLLAAPLVPYNTVGLFMAAIMAISGLVTIVLLPAILGLFHQRLLAPSPAPKLPTPTPPQRSR